MTETIKVALIAAAPGFVTGLATLISSLKNAKTLGRNTEKIEAIHEKTNGMSEALIASTAKASHAEGMADQRAEDREYKKPKL